MLSLKLDSSSGSQKRQQIRKAFDYILSSVIRYCYCRLSGSQIIDTVKKKSDMFLVTWIDFNANILLVAESQSFKIWTWCEFTLLKAVLDQVLVSQLLYDEMKIFSMTSAYKYRYLNYIKVFKFKLNIACFWLIVAVTWQRAEHC